MCRFERNLNRIYSLSGIILLIFLIIGMMSSCTEDRKCYRYEDNEGRNITYNCYYGDIELCGNCEFDENSIK